MFESLRGVGDRPDFTARWQCAPQHFAPWGQSVSDGDSTADQASPAPATEDDLWTSGFAAGRADAEGALEREADAMDALLRALDRLAPVPSADIAERLETEVRALLAQLVGTATVDEALLIERCAALADIAGGDGVAALRVHPDDAELLAAAQPSLTIIGDDRLPRGELLLIDGAGEAAAGPRTMLADWAAQSGDAPC